MNDHLEEIRVLREALEAVKKQLEDSLERERVLRTAASHAVEALEIAIRKRS